MTLLLIFALMQAPTTSPTGRGRVTGQIRSADGQPLSGVSVFIAAGTLKNGKTNLVPLAVSFPNTMAQTDGNGRYRLENIPPGRYYIFAKPNGSSNGDVPTLYPGVTELEAARKVELGPDSEINGIDFSISRSRLAKVSGHVFNAIAGTPSRVASVNLTGGLFGSFRTMVDANGSFQFLNVPVGEYVVWSSEENSGPDRAFSTKRITVTENGLNDLELIFKPPVPVTGRVIIEDGGAFQNPVMVPGITFNLIEGTLGTGTTALMDGSFQLGRLKGTGLVDGEYRVSVDHLPGDYYVKSMSFGSSDLLRENLKIAGPPAAQIAITLARGTSVAGNILDDNHLAARNVLVYLIPRTAAEAASYLARKAQTNQDGGFVIHGIAPGDYTIFAISSPVAGSEQDPEFTKDYETRGMPITASREAHPPLTLPLLR